MVSKLKEATDLLFYLDVSIPNIGGKLLYICTIFDSISDMIHTGDKDASIILIEIQSYKQLLVCYSNDLDAAFNISRIITKRVTIIKNELKEDKYSNIDTTILHNINNVMSTIYKIVKNIYESREEE